ncbi:MAG: dialkylresorcinol condensing enzyme DarA [Flavobacteriaceae bacterium]|nr:dialkylresorcinol condensing enzyme DarA [Flavobacteriaceae bacterium]
MKKVLVVYYSQSGQLLDISKNITRELENSSEVNLSFYEIKLKKNFPFPWDKKTFFNAFPETFLQISSELVGLEDPILKEKYDLIILSYQVWYLSPSIPVNSFLTSDIAKILFKNTPTVTVIGCRNMWIMAQEKMKELLIQNKANLVGNIALVDRHINHISVITILHWMMKGVKTKFLGIFPKPGVSDKDISESTKFGPVILNSLLKGNYENLQGQLLKKNAIVIKPFLIVMDKRANVLFGKWANFISSKGIANSESRQPFIKLFSIYLTVAIWLIAPIVFLLFLLTFIPLTKSRNRDKKYYSSVHIKKN